MFNKLPRCKIVTTESSLQSNPGDPGTNGKYTEIVRRVEELLERRAAGELNSEEQDTGEAYLVAAGNVLYSSSSNLNLKHESDDVTVTVSEEEIRQLTRGFVKQTLLGGNDSSSDNFSNIHFHIPESTARQISDQELSVKVNGPDGVPTPVHSDEYLFNVRENTRRALAQAEAYFEETLKREEKKKEEESLQKTPTSKVSGCCERMFPKLPKTNSQQSRKSNKSSNHSTPRSTPKRNFSQANRSNSDRSDTSCSVDSSYGLTDFWLRPPETAALLSVGNSASVDGAKTETAARVAAAALLDLTREVAIQKTFNSGFLLGKPPTHHALGNAVLARYPAVLRRGESNESSPIGFCHLNSIATAVGSLLNGEISYSKPPETVSGDSHFVPDTLSFPPFKRIAIFDFDVHHGNANEDTFWYDSRVLTISMHEQHLWPGADNGRVEYTGDEDLAPNSVLNIPLPSKSGDSLYCEAVETQVLPKMRKFDPEVIFIAAGFDAMKDDGYACQLLTAEWYGWCVQEVRKTFNSIPILLNLEGGYNPSNVEKAVGRVIEGLCTSNSKLEESDDSARSNLSYYFQLESLSDVERRERADEDLCAEVEMVYGKGESELGDKEKENLARKRDRKREVKAKFGRS